MAVKAKFKVGRASVADQTKNCAVCGATAGDPCTVVSSDPNDGLRPGDVRPVLHFYRGAGQTNKGSDRANV